MLIPLLIFLGTYLVLAIGRLPGFGVDRTGAAIVGASLMIAFGVLSLEEAFQSIHDETILQLLGLTIFVIFLMYRGEFTDQRRVEIGSQRVRVNRVLLWKSLIAAAVMIVLFFAGWPVSKVAVVTGAALLITRRVKPEKVYREID